METVFAMYFVQGKKPAFNNYIDILWRCGGMGVVVVVFVWDFLGLFFFFIGIKTSLSLSFQ